MCYTSWSSILTLSFLDGDMDGIDQILVKLFVRITFHRRSILSTRKTLSIVSRGSYFSLLLTLWNIRILFELFESLKSIKSMDENQQYFEIKLQNSCQHRLLLDRLNKFIRQLKIDIADWKMFRTRNSFFKPFYSVFCEHICWFFQLFLIRHSFFHFRHRKTF